MKNVKKISIGAVMAILAATGYGGYTIIKEKDLESLQSGQTALYEVARVIDGDTFELAPARNASGIADAGGGGERVRLMGIDAPDEEECYFKESKEALSKLVEGKAVELRKDVTDTDEYGRLLRHAILPSGGSAGGSGEDNVLVEEYMVKGGYAVSRSNPRDKLYYKLLLEAKNQAKAAGAGLWGACDFESKDPTQGDTPPPSAECSIKGNISLHTYEKTYSLKECAQYSQTKIDPTLGEKYFCSEAEAKKAGFQKAANCP
ncbi:MAG: thermonuclease family protein [bacterium]|nr:thermonuclease family protein [bacterium]